MRIVSHVTSYRVRPNISGMARFLGSRCVKLYQYFAWEKTAQCLVLRLANQSTMVKPSEAGPFQRIDLNASLCNVFASIALRPLPRSSILFSRHEKHFEANQADSDAAKPTMQTPHQLVLPVAAALQNKLGVRSQAKSRDAH